MRILVVPSFYPTREKPTLGIFVRDQASLLGEMGHEVHVASLEARSVRQLGLKKLAQSHFQVEVNRAATHLELCQRGWNTLAQTRIGAEIWIRMAARLAQRIHRYNPASLLFTHNAILAGGVGASISGKWRIPSILTEHSSSVLSGRLTPWEVRLCRRAYAAASMVIAVSNALAAEIRKLAPGNQRVVVVPNPIDDTFFEAQPSPKGNGHTFGTISNLVAIKQIDQALIAFSEVNRQDGQTRFIIGGGGPEEEQLKNLCGELGIRSSVTFTGALDRAGVKKWMASINTLCISSKHETFGMIAAEAMAMGIPVMSTDCGGPVDFITPDSGMIVKGPITQSFVPAMLKRIQQPDQFNPDAIRSHIKDMCSRAAVAKQLRGVIDKVAAEPASPNLPV